MNEFAEITRNELVIFVVSLLLSTALGTVVTVILFKSTKSTATFKYRGIALGGGVAFFTIFFLVICYYFLPFLSRKPEKEKLLPLSIPQNSVVYGQPEFALALPISVNQNRIMAQKMYYFLLNNPDDFNDLEKNKQELQFMLITVAQFTSSEDMDVDELSKSAIEETKQQLTTVSSNPNLTVNIISYDYTPILGQNGSTMTWEMKFLDERTGETKITRFKIKTFADVKNLRFYSIAHTSDEKTEQIVSTFNIPSNS